MNKRILLATSALIAGFASTASAVDVEMYGQANKGVLVYDDGRDTETNFVDNSRSSSRFGFRGSQALDNGLTASVLIEQELESNASDAVTQGIGFVDTNNNGVQNADENSIQSTAAGGAASLRERHTRVGLAGDWGAVFLGHTSTATDGITEIDLAGADDVIGSNVEDIGGGLSFRRANGAFINRGAMTVGSAFDNMDGIAGDNSDRTETIRYDSPIFHGFQGRIAAAQGGTVDGAILYNGKIDAFQIAAGAGYVRKNDAASNQLVYESQYSGVLSVKHDSGLGVTAAYGAQEFENPGQNVTDEPQFWYAKAGYSWDAFEVAADYAMYERAGRSVSTAAGFTGGDALVSRDLETTAYGVGGQYNMGHGVSVAAFYRNIEADVTGLNVEDINLYGMNLRVKF